MIPRRHHQGFTLIELLISVTILALITVIVHQSFISVTSTTDIARTEARKLRERQYIWRSFSENMAAIYTDPACEQAAYTLFGEDNEGPAGPGDNITFTTTLPMPGSTALPGVLRKVTYEVVEPGEVDADEATSSASIDLTDEELPPAYLLITEAPLVLDEDELGTDEDALLAQTRVRQVPISSMDIVYYDHETEEWVEEWDSAEREQLPWAIGVAIYLARSAADADMETSMGIDADMDPDLDMTFVVPGGAGMKAPFFDPNHYRLAPGASSADSIFNESGTNQNRPERRNR